SLLVRDAARERSAGRLPRGGSREQEQRGQSKGGGAARDSPKLSHGNTPPSSCCSRSPNRDRRVPAAHLPSGREESVLQPESRRTRRRGRARCRSRPGPPAASRKKSP